MEETFEPRSPRSNPKSPRRSQLLGVARMDSSSLKLEKQQEIQQKIEPNRKLLRQMLAISEDDRKIVRNSIMLGPNFKVEDLALSEPHLRDESLNVTPRQRLKRYRSSLPNNSSSLVSVALAPPSTKSATLLKKSVSIFAESMDSPKQSSKSSTLVSFKPDTTPIPSTEPEVPQPQEPSQQPTDESQKCESSSPEVHQQVPELASGDSQSNELKSSSAPAKSQSNELQMASEDSNESLISPTELPIVKSASSPLPGAESGTLLVESLGESASSLVLGILNGDVDVVEEYVSFFDAEECAQVHEQLSELMNKLYLNEEASEPPKLTDSFVMGLGITPTDLSSMMYKESPI